MTTNDESYVQRPSDQPYNIPPHTLEYVTAEKYRALAARLERAMGLLRGAIELLHTDWKAENDKRMEDGGPVWSDEYFRKTNVHPWYMQVNALLTEHQQETRP